MITIQQCNRCHLEAYIADDQPCWRCPSCHHKHVSAAPETSWTWKTGLFWMLAAAALYAAVASHPPPDGPSYKVVPTGGD